MNNRMIKTLTAIILAAILLPLLSLPVRADDTYRETEGKSGNKIIIADCANLYGEENLSRIEAAMSGVDAYPVVAAVTISAFPQGCRNLKEASEYYFHQFVSSNAENDESILFLIDAGSREAYIYCPKEAPNALPKGQRNNIIDNISFHLLTGNFAESTIKAFQLIKEASWGHKITSPMKFICNGILALIASLIINLAFVLHLSKLRLTGQREVISYSNRTMNPGTITPKRVIRTHKVYSPQNKIMEEKN